MCGLVWRGEGELDFLGVEVIESRLQPDESIFAALGRELAPFESLVVALQRLFGAGDLGAYRGEPLFELRSALLGLGGRRGKCVAYELFVAVDGGELAEDRVFEFLAGEAF